MNGRPVRMEFTRIGILSGYDPDRNIIPLRVNGPQVFGRGHVIYRECIICAN